MTTTNTTHTLAIRQALKDSGPATAERQLMIIGRDNGDEHLALIVQELRPEEVTTLLTEGDFTKPSLAAPFVTPEQLIEAFSRMGAKWGRISIDDPLPRLQDEVADLILSVVLPASESRKTALLEALLADDLGENVIVALSVYQKGALEFIGDPNLGHFERGTWQELYTEIAERDIDAFLKIREKIRGLYAEELEHPDDRHGKATTFLLRTLQALRRRAEEFVDKNLENGEGGDVFVGLD